MRTNRRKMMRLILPNTYERLKYVDNGENKVGSQTWYDAPFILTNIILSKDTRINLDIAIKYFYKGGYGYNIAGQYSPDNANIDYFIGSNDNRNIIVKSYDKVHTANLLTTKGQYEDRKRIIITADLSNNSLIVDFGKGNVERVTSTSAVILTHKKQISLLTITPHLPPYCRLYGSEIYQQNVLVCKLVPAKRKSDGMIGMYDTIGDRFYTSPNRLAFTGG